MEVNVLNHYNFSLLNIKEDDIDKLIDVFFILIFDTSGLLSTPYYKKQHSNLLMLAFDDVSDDNLKVKKNKHPYSEEHNKLLYEFIKKHKDKRVCYVCCTAGISRSGAVGTFINNFYGESQVEFLKRNPDVAPNSRILRMLNQLYRLEKDSFDMQKKI